MPKDKDSSSIVEPARGPMLGGMVVPEYDSKYIYCAYCGTKLVWTEIDSPHGYDPITGEKFPVRKAYGCPNYGSKGWHYYWWEIFR